MNQLALEKDYYIQMQEEEIARLSQVCNIFQYSFLVDSELVDVQTV